mgnify:CR=1 FL=1
MNRRGFLAAAVAVVAALTAFGGLNVGVSDMCSDDPGRFYVPALTKVGHQAEVIPFCTDTNLLREAVRKFDLVLFTGGEDVNPARYGAAPSPKLGRMNLRRDEYEFALFAACVAERKPVFGICRGVQFLNVAEGGSLFLGRRLRIVHKQRLIFQNTVEMVEQRRCNGRHCKSGGRAYVGRSAESLVSLTV